MIKHKRHSNRADGFDVGAVQPSDWNDPHDVDGLIGVLLSLAAVPGLPYIKPDGSAGLTSLSEPARAMLGAATVALIRAAIGAAAVDSQNFTGAPTAPTPARGLNTNQIATMAALKAMRDDLVGAAPGTLDALNELAAALGNDPNFSATVMTALGNRLRFDSGQSLSASQIAQLKANATLGTAAFLDAGTTGSKIVQLGSDGKLQSHDGSNLINVSVSWGGVSGKPAFGTASLRDAGSSANNAVVLDSAAKLPAIDASQLTNVPLAAGAARLGMSSAMTNGTLVASVAAGALTVSVKTLAGIDPSPSDPVVFSFRDTALTSGGLTMVSVTAALSIVLPSGATLGAVSGAGLRVWLMAVNDAGTVRLAAAKFTDALGCSPFHEYKKITTSVPGNSAKVGYSTVAVTTAAPWRLIGFCEWNSLTAAGTWTAPDYVQLFGPGVYKPGEVIRTRTSASLTTYSTTSGSPQTTNLAIGYVPVSAANLVTLMATGTTRINSAGILAYTGLYRDATKLIENEAYCVGAAPFKFPNTLVAYDLPATTALVTYAVTIRNNDGAATVTWGDDNTTTMLIIQEIMG